MDSGGLRRVLDRRRAGADQPLYWALFSAAISSSGSRPGTWPPPLGPRCRDSDGEPWGQLAAIVGQCHGAPRIRAARGAADAPGRATDMPRRGQPRPVYLKVEERRFAISSAGRQCAAAPANGGRTAGPLRCVLDGILAEAPGEACWARRRRGCLPPRATLGMAFANQLSNGFSNLAVRVLRVSIEVVRGRCMRSRSVSQQSAHSKPERATSALAGQLRLIFLCCGTRPVDPAGRASGFGGTRVQSCQSDGV